MNFLITPKPSNWLLAPGVLGMFLMLTALVWSCSGSQQQVTVNDPTSLCTSALVTSEVLKTQATKLGLEPAKLAEQVCASAVLGLQLLEANLLRAAGAAGAPSSPDWIPMNTAGAGG